MFDPLMPSLSSFCAVEKPGIPYKTGGLEHFCDAAGPETSWTEPESSAGIDLFHNEGCDASLMRSWIRLGINNQNIGVRPIGDPELVAVQNIIVS